MRVYIAYNDRDMIGVYATEDDVRARLGRLAVQYRDSWDAGTLTFGPWVPMANGSAFRNVETENGHQWEQWYDMWEVQP